MNKKNTIGVFSLGIVMLLLLGPLLEKHFGILAGRTHYQWFPLLLVFLPIVFTVQWRKASPAEDKPMSWALIVGGFGIVLLTAVAYLYFTGWVAVVAAIGVLGILAAYASGFRRVDRLFGIWALLFLLVRLPNQIEGRLLILFQNISAKVASVIVDQSGTYHVVQGGNMVIDGYEIDLAKICNGYFSIVSMVVIVSLYALWRRRPVMHVALLVAGAFGIATAVNVLRVATVAIVYAKAGFDLMDTGWFYLMAVVSFGLSFLLLLSVDALLSFFLQPVTINEHKKDGRGMGVAWNAIVDFRAGEFLAKFRRPAAQQAESKKRPVLVGLVVVSLLALTSFEAVVLYYRWGFGSYDTYFMHDKETLAIIEPDEIEFTRPGWELLSVDVEEREMSSIWGAYSFVWRLQYYDTMVIMALDYPFDKWHDVKRCYTKLGWQVDTEALAMLPSYNQWGASETQMTLPTGDYGFIMCSHSDHKGGIVQPKPTDHQWSMVKYYLHPKQWTAPFGVSVDKNQNTFYQTQVMVTSAFPLDEPTKQEIREMYGEFRAQTRDLIEQKSVDE